MKTEFIREQLLPRAITSADALAYKDFCTRFFGTEEVKMFLGGKDIQALENWESFLSESPYTLFGLFHGNKMVGTSAILFNPEEAIFTGIMIDPDYQKRGLADYLHDVRKRYLVETDHQGPVTTTILPNNNPSIKAAERNGFKLIGQKNGDGVTYQIYSLE